MTAKRIGWAGIALGFLAFFIAVPPLLVRSFAVVVLVALGAIALGAYAVGRGEKRIGEAIAASEGGRTRSMSV